MLDGAFHAPSSISPSIKDPHAKVENGFEDEEIGLAMSKEVIYRFASRPTKVREVRRDERGFPRQPQADRRMVRRGDPPVRLPCTYAPTPLGLQKSTI